MKKTLYTISVIALALFAAACQSEIMPDGEDYGPDGALCFRPALGGVAGNGVYAKSSELVSTDGSVSIPLTCIVSDGIAGTSPTNSASPMTKGELLNTTAQWDSLGKYIDKFFVAAWKGGSSFVPANTEVAKATPLWKTAAAYQWEASEEATFYAYANLPASGASVAATSTAQTLTYSAVPGASSAQTDILMGYSSGKPVYDATLHKGGIAEVKFYHPLTAVQFKKGVFDGEVSFKSICIHGVYDSGTTQLLPASIDAEDSGDKFTWNTEGSGTRDVTMAPVSGTYLPVGADNLIGDAFLLIPQTITATNSVKITVVADIDGVEKKLEAKLTDNAWKAGKTNTYHISFSSASYEFSLEGGKSSKSLEIVDNLDTGNDKTRTVPVTSTRTEEGGTPESWGWTISTVKVGDGSEVPYNDGDKVCGLEFEKSGGNLIVKATHRTSVDPSTNSYWTNDNGRTDNLEWTPDPLSRTGVTDLSTFNFMTEGSQAMNTANCYIIRRAGTYKLPLVYGNGIVNGAENVQAYAPVMATGGTAAWFLSPFVNHTGAGITSAFIENNTGCTAMSAGIIWQDKAVVVKNLSIEDGAAPHTAGSPYTTGDVRYLQFDVDVHTICQNNAIIAIYDGPDCTGNVIWSWHIWTTNSPALLQNAIPVTNYDGNEYDFFPITNLGWIDWLFFPAEEDVTVKLVQNTTGSALEVTVKQPERSMRSTGCWYQFGRKDPICNRPSKNYFPGNPADGTFNPYGEGPVGLDAAIRTPGTFYKASSSGYRNWADTPYNNLWTGKFCKSGDVEQNDDMIKTIYDPSPVGYKVPASKAFSGFTLNGSSASSIDGINKEGDFMNGWNLYTKPGKQGPTIFFAASSQRVYNTGDATGSPTYGMYRSANPKDEGATADDAYYLYIQTATLQTSSSHTRSYGFSVRPVIDPTMPDNPMQ